MTTAAVGRSGGRAVGLCAVLLSVYPPSRLTAQSGVEVHGYVQPRYQLIGDSGEFFLRRARFGVQGALTPWASYKAQAELRTGGTGATAATIAATDLYVLLVQGRWSATIGQAKTPFSRELIHQSSTLELPERSLVVEALSASRDIGVTGEWRAAERVTVQGGVYNGEGVNRAANPDRRMLYIGRLVATLAHGAELGGGVAAYSRNRRWEVEAEVGRGAWLGRVEYLRQDRTAPAAHADGWYLLGAYRIPRRPVQLVGRVEQFDPSDAPTDRTSGYTAGAQYFFRGDDLKVMASYTVFAEEGASVSNNRVIVQMQARF